ncbi:S9 family peptidase [Litorihabitans aurantiacus]|uniref:Peptide hydrolase n=1 Tax=Litorihabitans aurantiacus TaxID=1930061 RepID=A0AA37XH30_9MICO|nr:prolyl oligopeptidase family serine peptidase [Litorihabitans aurantiacus]GMA32600.1 peptide hydrolase [Litorihabitans aurantiacus]
MTQAWEARFRAGHVSLPDWAQDSPDRACVIASHDGVRQVHSLDVTSGALTVATSRPAGTTDATISPDGAWLWWFDDSGGDEYGVWRRQSFGSGPDSTARTPLDSPAAYGAGLLLGLDGVVVVGSSDDGGTRVHVHEVSPDDGGTPAPGRLLYEHEQDAAAAALSHDGALVAIEHSERGDNRHPALRVLRTAEDAAGAVVADLDDGAGLGLGALAFAPRDGDARLLVQHERAGRPELLVWDPTTGASDAVDLGLPGDVADADWFEDADALLVAVDHEARTRLYRHDLTTGTTTPIGPDDGTVGSATTRPDGDVWFTWSSAAQPRSVRSLASGVLLEAPGTTAPPSVVAQDVWAEGPGGRVHALLRRPADAPAGPLPVVVEVHGGPTAHETDSFAPDLAAWVDHGFAVLTVNYRGSTGYGSAWRDALEASVGFTELEDVAAVHAHLVAQGVLDPARSVLAGASWGGYLTLLGLGTQPERWSVGVAGVPVADYVAAYEDEMDSLQAFDRSLFGGSPTDVPEAYRLASPLTYAGAVVAPVLVLAGENDPRCPIRQIENYLGALTARGDAPVVETYRYEAGHGSYADDERIAQMRAQLEFVLRHVQP